MPIYEFYCDDCDTIFNFLSKKVDTKTVPDCPKCQKKALQRYLSTFVSTSQQGKDFHSDNQEVDEAKLEKAFGEMVSHASSIEKADSQQMAVMMRKFADNAGVILAEPMQEAIERMEQGEDAAKIESELEDFLLGYEEKVSVQDEGGKVLGQPTVDETLYDLE
jgi:putative FmdB family regulatory protein